MAKEYGMLQVLGNGARATRSQKEMFRTELDGGMDAPDQPIIDVFICKLRKKLAHASEEAGKERVY